MSAAAGDNGSGDAQGARHQGAGGQGAPHTDFPASSPHVLACGGTALRLDANGAVEVETVWNDGAQGGSTGGGVSDAFGVPDWQAKAGVPGRAGTSSSGKAGRGVPDVAAVADPQTGYQVLIDGRASVIGGTSAVAPLWAGLICRLVQNLGAPLGLMHPKIYAGASADASPRGFRDITEGSNDAYAADAGWDACTGLGVPDGVVLLDVLRAGVR